MKNKQVSAPRAEKVTALTGLELRAAALEALGWYIREQEEGVRLHSPGGSFWPCRQTIEAAFKDGPAIESDPAVSEPMFLEWCEKHAPLNWRMDYGFQGRAVNGGKYCFGLVVWGAGIHPRASMDAHIRVVGATPSEARARAIVAAGTNQPNSSDESIGVPNVTPQGRDVTSESSDIESLRASLKVAVEAIECRPHTLDCVENWSASGNKCTCWKSEALSKIKGDSK